MITFLSCGMLQNSLVSILYRSKSYLAAYIYALIISAITINYNGKATVHWVEGERAEYNGVRTYLTVTYSNEEEYFNVTQCISGGMGN